MKLHMVAPLYSAQICIRRTSSVRKTLSVIYKTDDVEVRDMNKKASSIVYLVRAYALTQSPQPIRDFRYACWCNKSPYCHFSNDVAKSSIPYVFDLFSCRPEIVSVE